MLCRRYSIVGIITMLMIYAICLSVIFLVLAMFARFRASSWISLIWAVCLLLSVNQQPRNLNGWFLEIELSVELRNCIEDAVCLVMKIDLLGLTCISAIW